MADSPTISSSNYNLNTTQRKHNSPIERRPRTLKDFLHDDSNSCSSNGFNSFPRKSYQNSSIFPENLNNSQRLQRCRSKAASTTISAFQAMINAIKSLSPRKPLKRNSQSQLHKENEGTDIKITMTIKDIIRWKSFRDLVEEKSLPSDHTSSSPHHCTTATTTTGSNTPCSSNGSSWCDSDYTSEYLPSDEYDAGIVGKKFSPCVGKDPMKTRTTTPTKTASKTDTGPKHASDDTEQKSPLSVLDFEHGELELETKIDRNGDVACELVKSCLRVEHVETTTREGCVREMEREGRWRNFQFGEEQEELAMGVERWVMKTLVDELVVDLQ